MKKWLEHYKDVAPMMRNVQQYQPGGKVHAPIYGTKKQKQAYDDSVKEYNQYLQERNNHIAAGHQMRLDSEPEAFGYPNGAVTFASSPNVQYPEWTVLKKNKAVQPVKIKEQPIQINQIQPTQYTGPQQSRLNPLQMPERDYSNDIWMSPGIVDGAWQPAGFYPQKQYQIGGKVPPFVTSDKALYDKRKQAYDDSLHLYNITAPDVQVFNNPDNSFGDFSDYMKGKYGVDKKKSNLLHTVTNDTYKEDPAYNRLAEYNGLDGVGMHRNEREWMAGLQTGILKYFDAPKQQVIYDSPVVQQPPVKKLLPKSKPVKKIEIKGLQQIQNQPQSIGQLQLPIDQSNYEWHSPEVINNQQIHPAGFYPPYKANIDPIQDNKFQEGGSVPQKGWLENIVSKIPGYTPSRRLQPWEHRIGNEIHTDVNRLPTTDKYAPDVQWQQNWIDQRGAQYDALAKNQTDTYAKEHPILNFFGANDDPQKLVNMQKANTTNNLRTLKFNDGDKIAGDTYVDAVMGEYSPYKHRVVFPVPPDVATKAHEIGHGTHLAQWQPSQTFINQITSQDPQFKSYKGENAGYYKSPEEIYSHIWGLRRDWNLKPTDKVTPEMIQKKKKDIFGSDTDPIFKYLSDDSIIKLMNGLVSNNQPNKSNKLIAQSGGKVSTQGYKKNSPDNKADWLTIKSPNITMSDVPHPVMAYPNNGQQPILMQPGVENYTFPGATEVREVPVNRVNRIHGAHYQQGGPWIQNQGAWWNASPSEGAIGANTQMSNWNLPQESMYTGPQRYNPEGAMPYTPVPIGQQRQQKSNYHTDESANYGVDSVRQAKNGGCTSCNKKWLEQFK